MSKTFMETLVLLVPKDILVPSVEPGSKGDVGVKGEIGDVGSKVEKISQCDRAETFGVLPDYMIIQLVIK